MSKVRLDVYLQNQGLANSRTHAQEMIKAGQVKIDGKVCTKNSAPVEDSNAVEVESGEANRYVSRGGLKLEGALKSLNLNVEGMRVLDIGISTGGFTDCLLQSGVSSVMGVDVGHDQVHKSLLNNRKLQVFEGINARNLSSQDFLKGQSFDLAVMDVSFISITLILPEIARVLGSGAKLLSLVKPQFEVGPENLARGGIVKDERLYDEVKNKVIEVSEKSGFTIIDYISSPIEGKDGNREFFIYASKNEVRDL